MDTQTDEKSEELKEKIVEEAVETNEVAEEATKDENDTLAEELMDKEKEELVLLFIELKKEKNELELKAKENEEKANEHFNNFKRSLAEVENVRKRTASEKQDAIKYANAKIVEDLLTILDDFQRAIDSAKNHEMEFDNFLEGIDMIEKQFADLLFKKYGVEKIGESGEEFDPNKHQAVMMETGDYETEVLVEVFRKGYSLHDRVLRPAQVKIGKPE